MSERVSSGREGARPAAELIQIKAFGAVRVQLRVAAYRDHRESIMYKDIVVPITGTPGDTQALHIALDVAAAHAAHLTVLEMVNLPLPVIGPMGFIPDAVPGDLHARLREQGLLNVDALRASLEKDPVSSEVRLVEAFLLEPAQAAAHHARHADLAVLAGVAGDSVEGDISHAYFSALLMQSGRPVLVVPARCKVEMPPRRIVAAWRPTAECARAFHDALPFMVAADGVELLIVDPVIGERGHGEQPGTDIAAHLSRHGVNVRVLARPSHDNRIATVLLDHVKDVQADMLVVGGYGHSRLREWALGGVTRELLFTAHVPVFYSH